MRRGGVNYEYSAFFEALYDLVRDAYSIPVGSPILESGDDLIEINENDYALRWGAIQLDGEVNVRRGSEVGLAANDIVSTFDLYLWVLMKRVADTNMNALVRQALSEMSERLWSDPHLSGTCNNVEPLGVSWTGTNRGLQVYAPTGMGIARGYCGFRFYLIESRVRTIV